MLVQIPKVLDAAQLQQFHAELKEVEWSDGRGSAGYISQQVKQNLQLPDDHPLARKLGEVILRSLGSNPLFTAAALPFKIVPPLFNCYGPSQTYGRHVDGAIRPVTGTPHRVRTDVSATLFLSDPDSYEGGELVIEDTYGQRAIKLAAGDMVLYPGTSVHSVTPVKKGVRLAAFFWIQSMVREDHKRVLLFELDRAIQKVATDQPAQSALTDLAGVYHNLLRLWADS
ncbi:MAG: Fe2+-dependent dioxygenase [Pseudomonadota bacterium]